MSPNLLSLHFGTAYPRTLQCFTLAAQPAALAGQLFWALSSHQFAWARAMQARSPVVLSSQCCSPFFLSWPVGCHGCPVLYPTPSTFLSASTCCQGTKVKPGSAVSLICCFQMCHRYAPMAHSLAFRLLFRVRACFRLMSRCLSNAFRHIRGYQKGVGHSSKSSVQWDPEHRVGRCSTRASFRGVMS